MLKKLVVVAGGAALLLGLFFGRDACSYISTGWRQVHGAVNESVPISFQLKRARDMIKSLDPEIKRNMQLIAREEVEIDRLQHDVTKGRETLAKQKEHITQLASDLKNGSSFVYAGKQYTEKRVKSDLEGRFTRYQVSEATISKLEKILEARQRGLESSRVQLAEMQSAKRQCEVDVENLEARMKMVEVAQTSSSFNFDDSRLARTKELLTEIQTRIDVQEKVVGTVVDTEGEIPLESTSEDTDIVQKVTDYFGDKSAENVTLVETKK